MTSLVKHHVQGHIVPQRVPDGYIDATAMCQAAGKRLNNYLRSDTTKAFVSALEADTRIRATELIQVFRGGTPELQGTWVHPQVAINLAQWLSPRFAVRVTSLVLDWMAGLQRHQAFERLLLPEPGDWEKRFPDEFYKHIYRLRNWKWPGMGVNRYQIVAHYTNDIVWNRLAPGLREELENRNPMQTSGERGAKHHQLLRDDPLQKLMAHVWAVIALMRASADWQHFMDNLRLAFPRLHEDRPLPFA